MFHVDSGFLRCRTFSKSLSTGNIPKTSDSLDREIKSLVRKMQRQGTLPSTDSPRVRLPNVKVKEGDQDRIILDFLEVLDSPRALTVWLLYKSKADHRQLVELTCNPSDYSDGASFRCAYAATKLLSKADFLKTGIDTEAVAIASAVQAEAKCRETNRRLRTNRYSSVNCPWNAQLFRAQQIIAKVLGPCPQPSFGGDDPSFPSVGWSPGRSTSSWGDRLSAVDKYSSSPDVTASAAQYAFDILADSPLWGAAVLHSAGPVSAVTLPIVEGNVMLVVPKNAKTGRTICYEPHMNIRLQLAVGAYLRKRLKFHGVNLDDQSVNQRRARYGSLTGSLATIDLKAASDTLSTELVLELLPVDWFELLDNLRSKYTLWPDGQRRWCEKFSSMGNGFTFELESLVFYALCSAVSESVSVYGDDIVMPVNRCSEAMELLSYCGFDVNTSKSYSTGYFRESCGSDWYFGSAVTPVYLRSRFRRVRDIVKFHNRIRSFACWNNNISESKRPLLLDWSRFSYNSRRLLKALYSVDFGEQFPFYVNRSLPSEYGDRALALMLRKWRQMYPSYLGPRGYGDGHYHVEFDEATPQKGLARVKHQLEGWLVTTEIPIYPESRLGRLHRFPEDLGFAALCAALGPRRTWSVEDQMVSYRRVRYKRIRMQVSSWPATHWLSAPMV